MSGTSAGASALTLHLGPDDLVIRRRYEALSIANDILIGVWFTVGSILFFSDSTATLGTWFFVIGSVELLIRPAIRLTRVVHLRRRAGDPGGETAGRDADEDY